MTKSNSQTVSLSLFDKHIHPVIAYDDAGNLVYSNQLVFDLFDSQKENLNAIQKQIESSISSSPDGELFTFKYKKFKINRLSSSDFGFQVLFLIPDSIKPQPNVIETGERAASLVAHLFRSPLTALLGLAEMVKHATDSNREEISNALVDGIHRIGGFVDDLDNFTKTDKPVLEQVSLPALIKQTIQDLPAKQQNRIELHLETSFLEIQSDPSILQKILSELIANGLANNPSDSTIQIRLKKDASLLIKSETPLTKEEESLLFDPFYSTGSQNWGLGMSRVVKWTRPLKGHISIEKNSRIDGLIIRIDFDS